VLDEVADPVAPVQEPAPFAIDVAEARLRRNDPLEAGGVGPFVGHARDGSRGLDSRTEDAIIDRHRSRARQLPWTGFAWRTGARRLVIGRSRATIALAALVVGACGAVGPTPSVPPTGSPSPTRCSDPFACQATQGPIRTLPPIPTATPDPLATPRRTVTPGDALRIATAYAGWLDAHDRRNDARALLAPLYASFSEGFDTRDLREARALLTRLDAQRDPTEASPAQAMTDSGDRQWHAARN